MTTELFQSMTSFRYSLDSNAGIRSGTQSNNAPRPAKKAPYASGTYLGFDVPELECVCWDAEAG